MSAKSAIKDLPVTPHSGIIDGFIRGQLEYFFN